LNTFGIIFAQIPNAQIVRSDDILQLEAAQSDAIVARELHNTGARTGENAWRRDVASADDSSACSVVECYRHKVPRALTSFDVHVSYRSCNLAEIAIKEDNLILT
jgi:hypothetical protein